MRYYDKILKYIFIFFILFTGCQKKVESDYKIGFVASLSGKYSELGTSIRNGVILAVNEINQKGGINGKKIELIIKDNKHNKNENIKVLKELINKNIKVIVGNATSSMTKISLPIINKNKVLMISPTASSNIFAKKDDYLFRLTHSNNQKTFQPVVKYLNSQNVNKVLIIYDNKNESYTKNWISLFQKTFNKKNKIITINQPFNNIKKEILNFNPDGIIIIANGLDSALLIQKLNLHQIKKPIVCSGWAKDKSFLENGGNAIKNVKLLGSIDMEAKNTKLIEFKKRYKNYFKEDANSFALRGYEAILVIAQALKIEPDISKLKNTILKINNFEGIIGKIKFDKYGDIDRKTEYLYKIQNGKFVRDEKFK